MKLDLGCGSRPMEGYVGVDLPVDERAQPVETGPAPHVDESGIIRFDLASGIPWPFEDSSIDGLFSSHMIEHLPSGRIVTHEWETGTANPWLLHGTGSQDALFWVLDQAWRVTKAGGELLLRWPALRNEETKEICLAAFQDPTHYRFIPLEQIHYWSRAGREMLGVSQYRVACNWVPKQICQRGLGAPGPDQVVENEVLFVKEI